MCEEQIAQLGVAFEGERVLLLGPVERDGRHASIVAAMPAEVAWRVVSKSLLVHFLRGRFRTGCGRKDTARAGSTPHRRRGRRCRRCAWCEFAGRADCRSVDPAGRTTPSYV